MAVRVAPVELKCPACKKLLIVGVFTGWVEAFCPRCKRKRRFDA